MKSKREKVRKVKRGVHCGADGQPCKGECRKENSKEGECKCPFTFNPADEVNLAL